MTQGHFNDNKGRAWCIDLVGDGHDRSRSYYRCVHNPDAIHATRSGVAILDELPEQGWLWLDPDRPLMIVLGKDGRVAVPVNVERDLYRAAYVEDNFFDLPGLLKLWRSIGGRVEVRGVGKQALLALAKLAATDEATCTRDV